MGWKQTASEYLSFSKKDRGGIIALLLIVAFIYILPKLAPPADDTLAIVADTAILSLIDTLEQRQPAYYKEANDERVDAFQRTQNTHFNNAEVFVFDPNTLSSAGWRRLGLSEKTAATIQKYVSKGGSFKKPEDLQKIWGLPKGFYERVAPYIKIESVASNKNFKTFYPAATPYEKKERKIIAIEVNSADTTAFISLPGIGSKLAVRIINFRDRLGGFHSVDQIKETYGVPDSTFQKVKAYLNANAAGVRKLNINTASKDELKLHPYIKWNLANAIVEYRNQHGAFKSLYDLKNIVLIDDATFIKIAPYLSL